MGNISYQNKILSKDGSRELLLEQLGEQQRKQLGNRLKKEAYASLGMMVEGMEEREKKI